MYVVSAEACTVTSGDSPPDAARAELDRARRADLESDIATSYETMERAVHRKPQDFAELEGVNLSALARGYPDMVPERVPARYRPWPEGYATGCTVRETQRPGVVLLRPIYEHPFPIASSTAPLAPPARQCPLQRYRAPYPARTGTPEIAPAEKPADRGWLWALAIGAVALAAAT